MSMRDGGTSDDQEVQPLLAVNSEAPARTPGQEASKNAAWLPTVVVFSCVFAVGLDYSIVMPSMWLYLRSLSPDVPEYMLGLALGAFALSSLLMQTPVGMWLDRRSMREVLVATLWVCLLGNFGYFMAPNVWCVVAARFVAGMGATLYLTTSVFIVRTTTDETRSARFAIMNSVMMVSMILGPAINYPITLTPRTTLPIATIDSLSVVGLIMCGFMLVLLVLVHTCFEEPPRPAKSDKNPGFFEMLRGVWGVDTGSLICAQFVALFNQTSMEVIIPPVVVAYYGFAQLATSICYMIITVYLLILFSVVGKLAGCVSDRFLILCGWLCVGAGTLVLLLSEVLSGPLALWQLGLGCLVFSTSSAFFESAVPSLFSKLAARRSSLPGSAQSLLVTFQSLAILIAPLLVAPLLNVALKWVFVMIMILWVLSFLFFLFSYRHLATPAAAATEIVR